MKPILLQPAYVLHRRPYRETSFLVDLFSSEHGRLTVVAKGARKARSAMQGLLQPFIALRVSWVGKGELMTLTYAEASAEPLRLQGECLFAGFYLNELLTCLLQKWDAHTALYRVYEKTLLSLQKTALEQRILRSFEKYLLEELGYGLLPQSDRNLYNSIILDRYYRFIPDQGFVLAPLQAEEANDAGLFSGVSLRAYADEDWQNEQTLRDAKRLTRLILAPLLGKRTLHSRKLFIMPDEEKIAHEK